MKQDFYFSLNLRIALPKEDDLEQSNSSEDGLLIVLNCFSDQLPQNPQEVEKAGKQAALIYGYELDFLCTHLPLQDLLVIRDAISFYLLSDGSRALLQARHNITYLQGEIFSRHKEKILKSELQWQIRRTQVLLEQEINSYGFVDIVFENQEVGLYRLYVKPGKSIPTHFHKVMHEAEFVLTDGLKLQGKKISAGESYIWPHNFPHRYDNDSQHTQVILCIDKPSFFQNDEVIIDAPLHSLNWPPAHLIKKYY